LLEQITTPKLQIGTKVPFSCQSALKPGLLGPIDIAERALNQKRLVKSAFIAGISLAIVAI